MSWLWFTLTAAAIGAVVVVSTMAYGDHRANVAYERVGAACGVAFLSEFKASTSRAHTDRLQASADAVVAQCRSER